VWAFLDANKDATAKDVIAGIRNQRSDRADAGRQTIQKSIRSNRAWPASSGAAAAGCVLPKTLTTPPRPNEARWPATGLFIWLDLPGAYVQLHHPDPSLQIRVNAGQVHRLSGLAHEPESGWATRYKAGVGLTRCWVAVVFAIGEGRCVAQCAMRCSGYSSSAYFANCSAQAFPVRW